MSDTIAVDVLHPRRSGSTEGPRHGVPVEDDALARVAEVLDVLNECLGPLEDTTIERVSPRCSCAELGVDAPCGWCDGPDRDE